MTKDRKMWILVWLGFLAAPAVLGLCGWVIVSCLGWIAAYSKILAMYAAWGALITFSCWIASKMPADFRPR